MTATEYLYERIPGGTIEAVQWTGYNADELKAWTSGAFNPGNPDHNYEGIARPTLWVAANGGSLEIVLNEWVAKDSKGFYPIKDDVFQRAWRKPPEPVLIEEAVLRKNPMDAAIWAHEFARAFTVTGGATNDDTEGLMLGWFANAMQFGYDAGFARASDPKAREVDLDEYTNASRAGDGVTVRVGDRVEHLWWSGSGTITRIFKPTPASRVRYELDNTRGHNQTQPVFAHDYRKVAKR
jgi:hypothetical protein